MASTRFILQSWGQVGSDLCQFVGPLLLNRLLESLERGDPAWIGHLYAFLIFVGVQVCQQLYVLWSAPFRIVIAMVLLYQQLGLASLLGALMLLLMIPVQVLCDLILILLENTVMHINRKSRWKVSTQWNVAAQFALATNISASLNDFQVMECQDRNNILHATEEAVVNLKDVYGGKT